MTVLPPLELWGGMECTTNRVGNRFSDQIELSGHCDRADDLEQFRELGIRTLRYPILWERVAPHGLASADWNHADRALEKMRELGINPIVGLVHHGSGPSHTSLLDDGFAAKLADFARAVAERYPWVDAYTPINEPLTTARFSALYGLWYPHARDDHSFVRAFLHQCAAIRDCMQVIREVNPLARLVQTEDLGRTYSTAPLQYQADFENHRRWLTFDVLTGRLDPSHPLWYFLSEAGASRAEMASFIARPCPPDVIGINHYLTSERFLDHRTELYPRRTRGDNGRDAYADVEAVRVVANGVAGHKGMLAEAWSRYHLPVAVTEVHLSCTREQQLRWLAEAWHAAVELRSKGCDVRAVTVWALLGSFGWDALLTGEHHRYESGVFDLRSPHPRPTALAAMTKALATTGRYEHPVLDGPGWWRTPARLSFATTSDERPAALTSPRFAARSIRPLLLVGGNGTLGAAFARACEARGLRFVAPRRSSLDIATRREIETAIADINPWAVINAAGYVRVDDAEWDSEACHRGNSSGAVNLAAVCAARGIPLLSFSSDLVFDGTSSVAYSETDRPNPLNVYGQSKLAAEEGIAAQAGDALVVRTSAFFGPWDAYNFLTQTLAMLEAGESVTAADDLIVSPTYLPDLTANSLDLLIDGERGIWHLANVGQLTWADFARRAAADVGLNGALVIGQSASSLGYLATRPRMSALRSERASLMPSVDDALARYLAERKPMRIAALAGER